MFFCLGVISTMLSCSSFDYQLPEYEKIADEITEATAQKLKEKKGLVLVGTGSQMMHDIQKMSMDFNFYKVVDITIARQLLIDSVQEYLSAINASQKVRPYLHNYPFTAENVEIVIYFYNPDRNNVSSGEINIAAANQGKVVYYIDYPDKYTLKAMHEETYEEAVQATSIR